MRYSVERRDGGRNSERCGNLIRLDKSGAVENVDLPTGATLHQIGNLLTRCHFFPQHPRRFALRFNVKKQVLDPVTVALLAAWADYWQSRDVPIDCKNLHGSGARYAQRLGLFDHLAVPNKPRIESHEPAGRFVELRRVSTQEELSALCAEVGGVLRAPHLINLAQYFLAEMARNAIEHAGAPAFACAQYYEKDKRVTIGIADCGRGIRESLRENYGFNTDRDAIVAALRPGVSGASKKPYAASDNAGLGLYYARGISYASGRPFAFISGNSAYKQLAKQIGNAPTHDPTKDKHRLLESVGSWQGTIVGLNIRGDHGNLDAFLARMGSALNVGPGMAKRPKLRFT